MITAIVTAIAITQREARREKQAREAETAEAAKKSILIVGAGVSGLVAAVLCANHGLTVTLVDQRSEEGIVEGGREGVAMLEEAAVGALREVEGLELRRGCEADAMVWKRAKSGKRLEISSFGMVFLELDLKGFLLNTFTGERRFGTRVEGYYDAHEDLDGPLPHGRPYVLTHKGERLYADCIIAADGHNGIGRRHVFASQQAEDTVVPTGWWKSTFVPGEPDEDEDEGVSLDKVEVHVADGSYLIAATVDGESVGVMYHGTLKPPVAEYHAGIRKLLVQAETTELNIHQKPAFLVSRASKKLVLCGSAAFTVPPHSPSVKTNFDIAASAALAVCLRKAASVPLGLEIWSRLASPRYVEVMKVAQERFNKVSGSAAEGELEVAEVRWDGWEWKGGKEAEKRFDDVVEALTRELLGKQMAMKEAALKQAQEAKIQRSNADEGLSKTEGGDGASEAEDANNTQEISDVEGTNDEQSPEGGVPARTAHTMSPVREIGERSPPLAQEATAPGQSKGKEVLSKEAGSDDNWHTVSPRDEVAGGAPPGEKTRKPDRARDPGEVAVGVGGVTNREAAETRSVWSPEIKIEEDGKADIARSGKGSADELQPFVQDAPDPEDGGTT